MSATGRGAERVENDVYNTPKWCVHRLLEGVELPGGRWLEPTAGTGAIIRAVNEVRNDITWQAVELRETTTELQQSLMLTGHRDSLIRAGTNFLEWPALDRTYKVAITNPPFLLAQEVITKCFDLADYVVMLLRVNFLGSDKRGDWIYEYVPDLHQLPNRPSFGRNKKGTKGTDATEYAWFVWPPGERTEGRLTILGRTPLAVRNEQWEKDNP